MARQAVPVGDVRRMVELMEAETARRRALVEPLPDLAELPGGSEVERPDNPTRRKLQASILEIHERHQWQAAVAEFMATRKEARRVWARRL